MSGPPPDEEPLPADEDYLGPVDVIASAVTVEAEREVAVHPRGRPWPTPADRVRGLGKVRKRISTGFETLDAATRGGPHKGAVVVVAGAAGSAKTSMALFLAWSWNRAGHAVAVLAADEHPDGLLIRIGQMEGLRREDLENGEPASRAALADTLDARGRFALLDSHEGGTVEAAVAEVARLAENGAGGVLVVDSLQTARALGTDNARDPRGRADAMMTALKQAARRGVLVLVTSEVSRGWYAGRPAERVNPLAAFKESSGIEYGADLALVLDPVRGKPGHVDVILAKNRMGERLPFRVAMHVERATFNEVEPAAGECIGTEGRAVDTRESDMEAVRDALRKNPGATGKQDLLDKSVKGMSKARKWAALKALESAGEIEDRGQKGRHSLYLKTVSLLSSLSPGETEETESQEVGRVSSPRSPGTLPEAEETGDASLSPLSSPPLGGRAAGESRREEKRPDDADRGRGERLPNRVAAPVAAPATAVSVVKARVRL